MPENKNLRFIQHSTNYEIEIKKFERDIKKFIEEIRKLIFAEYDFPPEKEKYAVKLYRPWVDALFDVSLSDEISLFTLNYDEIARIALMKIKKYEIVTGFRAIGDEYPILDINEYKKHKKREFGKRIIKIIPLHGELSWKRGYDGKIRRKSRTYSLDGADKDRVLIYPVLYGKNTNESPFNELYSFFEEELANTDILVVIGYSFRDERVNKIISKTLSKNMEFKVIYLSPEVSKLTSKDLPAISKEQIKKRFKLIDGKFEDSLSRGKVISRIADLK